METVNALKVRNHLGEILDHLNETGEPILISKGRKVRGVLVTLEEFERRFLDVKADEEKARILESLKPLRTRRKEDVSSLALLRQLRGYTE